MSNANDLAWYNLSIVVTTGSGPWTFALTVCAHSKDEAVAVSSAYVTGITGSAPQRVSRVAALPGPVIGFSTAYVNAVKAASGESLH
jgi:hypothetical protein